MQPILKHRQEYRKLIIDLNACLQKQFAIVAYKLLRYIETKDNNNYTDSSRFRTGHTELLLVARMIER